MLTVLSSEVATELRLELLGGKVGETQRERERERERERGEREREVYKYSVGIVVCRVSGNDGTGKAASHVWVRSGLE